MNALNDLRVRLALWIGGPTVQLWRARNAQAERMHLDDSARLLGFRNYADLEARCREGGESASLERGELAAFTRASPPPRHPVLSVRAETTYPAPGSDATDERGRFMSGDGYGGERK